MNTLDLIRKIDPCAGRDPDGARLDARLERLLAEAAREDAAAGQPARPWRAALEGNATPRRRARRAALGLGLAACLAAAAVVVSGGERVAPATAATLLSEARTAVLRLDGPGPWTVVTTVDWRNEPFRISRGRWGAALVPYETETWSSDHGQQLSRVTRRSDVRFPNPSDRDAYRGATTPLDRLDGKLIRRDTAGLDPTVAEIRALPANPAALAAKLGPDAVNQVVMLLLSPAPTAEQRAALYDVLLRTPGAKLVPRLTDPEGARTRCSPSARSTTSARRSAAC
jgi:hypothetical protein